MKKRENIMCCTGVQKSNPVLQILTSVPWCCIGSLVLIGLSVFSSVVPLAGVAAFDDFFHKWLLVPAVVLHLWGIIRYVFVEGHKTRNMNMLYVGLTFLFAVSILFHVSDFHDELFHGAENHAQQAHR